MADDKLSLAEVLREWLRLSEIRFVDPKYQQEMLKGIKRKTRKALKQYEYSDHNEK